MKREQKPLTDRQIQNLMIENLKDGGTPDRYAYGFAAAATAALIMDGGDRETLKRAARIFLGIYHRLDLVPQSKKTGKKPL